MALRLPAWAIAALLVLVSLPSSAADDRCTVAGLALAGGHWLPHTVAALDGRQRLNVVALGSSSTQGYGASEPRQSYPAQLAALLKVRFPHSIIRVTNKGVGGDDTAAMLARFARDVYPARPDLVIWQTGTNDAIEQVPLDRFRRDLMRGLTELKAAGAEVILMSPQYAPAYIAAKNFDGYVNAVQDAAATGGAALFDRFRLSEAWYFDRRFAEAPVVTADGLHQADAGYHCDAVVLAEGLADLVARRTKAAALP
jgi:lysophospholipase L1-like esterase